MNLKTFGYVKEDPKRIFSLLGSKGLLNWMPDKLYVKIQFRMAMGYWPNLKNPQTYNEKLQWLKLHDRNPLYTTLVDKYAVRQYIAETIGEEYLIPLVGGPWKNAGEIDFDALPEQFVLKCNHDSGGVIICKDKSKLDVEAAKALLNKRLNTNFYYANREWPYKNVEPCIIAEQYEKGETKELIDYKFMIFNGKFRCSFVCTERWSGEGLRVTFFDKDWNVMPFSRHYQRSEEEIKKPNCYDEMIEIAETLAKDLCFARIDLYEIDNQPAFGEITFFPGNGQEEFDPPEWDKRMGDWLKLPNNENGHCCSEKEG